MHRPELFTWDGEAMVPRHPRRADQLFVVGETYPLIINEDRSVATHNHEFAWLREAWLNLPETLADLYPSPEHLRKRALIEAGYSTYRDWETDRKSTRLNSSHRSLSRMPSSA